MSEKISLDSSDKCTIFREDKLHLGITFSCKHESSTLNLHYLCASI